MSAVRGDSTTPPGPWLYLRDVDRDFLRLVPDDERQQAGEFVVPAIDIGEGPFNPDSLLSEVAGMCAIVVSGMVNRQIQINGQVAMRVLGPGRVIPLSEAPSSEVIATSQWTAAGPVRLAVLGMQFARAASRWPHLQSSLVARLGEQNEEMAAQLALCQLPRVEDRVLAMLWLLAESWGKVTSAGTVLPLHLTHEALGAMVGARRPTVTLALGELVRKGLVVHRDGGWLLLAPPLQQAGNLSTIEAPQLLHLAPTAWARPDSPLDQTRERRQELLALVSRLRREHRETADRLRVRFREAAATRTQAVEIRDRLRGERARNKRSAPT